MIRALAGRLLRRPQPQPPEPEGPLVAIGDIPGCHSQFRDLLETIGDWLDDAHLVLLGDLVDRGPDSAAVIDLAMQLSADRPSDVTVLMGNHERMMLDFLAGLDPAGRWLQHGGAQTLASFGIEPPRGRDLSAPETLEALAGPARQAVGADRIAWLEARPLFHLSGDVVAVHAAWSTQRSANRQDPYLLIWGHPDFYRRPRRDLPWVVHGHVVTRPARTEGTRIAVDSGAYLGGGLSAVRLAPGEPPQFRSTGPEA